MRAKPGKGHHALAAIEQSGKLLRHYTLNVDGLADAVGLSTWHPVQQPEGGLHSQEPVYLHAKSSLQSQIPPRFPCLRCAVPSGEEESLHPALSEH